MLTTRFVDRRSASSSCLRRAVLVAVSLMLVGPEHGRALDAEQATARDSLSAVRVALGGDDVLRAITSLWIVGSTARGFNGVTGTLIPPYPAEIRLVLPDGYLRIDHGSAADARSGVAGSTLLNAWIPRGAGVHGIVRYGPDALTEERRERARLALGLLAHTDTMGSLRMRSVASNGRGRVVELVDGEGRGICCKM